MMAKISKYADSGALQDTDQAVIARAGDNKSLLGSNFAGGGGTGTTLPEGAALTYDAVDGYSLEAGSDWNVNGTELTWVASIARASLALAASTLYYVYLYDSGAGVAAVEESTTAPTWNSTYNYWQKTGDATRRCIGYIAVDSNGNIIKFVNTVLHYESEITFLGDNTSGSLTYKQVISAGSAGTQTAMDLSAHIPSHATQWRFAAKISFGASGNDATLGIDPSNGFGTSPYAAYTVRSQNGASGASNTFLGRSWMQIMTAQTAYYAITNNTGTNTAYVEAWGARFRR